MAAGGRWPCWSLPASGMKAPRWAVALEVVRNRLTEAGLDGYLLELHSQKATRKGVAVALGQALDTVTVPPAPMGELRVRDATARRQQLNAYATP
jgi:hypothetical protein